MRYIFPTRILSAENAEHTEVLLQESTLQIGLGERTLCRLSGKGHLLLDFGKELSGGVRILTFHAKNGRIRVRFGESVSEACAELGGAQNATNDHSLRDFQTELQNYSDMTFGQSAFRFVRIDSTEEKAELSIKSVVLACDTDTRPEIGTFSCNDPQVNAIWSTASHTLRLCLQNGYFWDGVKRDRLVWIGDLYPEMRAAHCLFGDVPETLHSLRYAMEETPLPQWVSKMPAYSLWWLVNLCDEYAVNGNPDTFAEFLPYIQGLIRQISEHVATDGSTLYPSNFIDWPSFYVRGGEPEKQVDVLAGMHYLTCIAIRKTATLLSVYGENTALCEDILLRLDRKSHTVCRYKQIAALGVWAGEQTVRHRELLLQGGAKGLSTFMSYPILTAVAAFGQYDTALRMMKDYYGGMLSVGATTFWEDFDLDWLENTTRIDELPRAGQTDIHGDRGAFCYTGFRHSLCHGWSAGVIPYLVETVVGVRQLGSGMRHLTVQPHLSGLKHVKATVPTPQGAVTIEHTLQEDGTVHTTVNAPQGVTVDVL